MPHEFKVKCYRDQAWNGKAKVGDTVYLKSCTDVPMTVVVSPSVNTDANRVGTVKVCWMCPDGSIQNAEFLADMLTL